MDGEKMKCLACHVKRRKDKVFGEVWRHESDCKTAIDDEKNALPFKVLEEKLFRVKK